MMRSLLFTIRVIILIEIFELGFETLYTEHWFPEKRSDLFIDQPSNPAIWSPAFFPNEIRRIYATVQKEIAERPRLKLQWFWQGEIRTEYIHELLLTTNFQERLFLQRGLCPASCSTRIPRVLQKFPQKRNISELKMNFPLTHCGCTKNFIDKNPLTNVSESYYLLLRWFELRYLNTPLRWSISIK